MSLKKPKTRFQPFLACSLPVLLAISACGSDGLSGIDSALADGEDVTISLSNDEDGNLVIGTSTTGDDDVAGGVFVMSNILEANTIVAYARADDGTLSLVGEFPTGGLGGDFDGDEGLDPLISAYSLINTPDNEYLMAVNAGSNTISVMQINDDMSLELVDTAPTLGVGPNSLAMNGDVVYVTNIDSDGEFTGEPDQEGSIYGYTFDSGDLTSIPGSLRQLENRPASVRFTPDGDQLVIASINAGSAALASGNDDSIVVFDLDEDGVPGDAPTDGTASTFPGDATGRNLPSAIGFEVVDRANGTFAIVTEAREFQSEGQPPAFPNLQTGSVSVFEVGDDGVFTSSQLDLTAGQSDTVGQRTACWIVLSPDGEYFWVANALDASISSFRFVDDGATIELIEEVAAAGVQPTSADPAVAFATTDGFIDLDITDDGAYLYQLFGLSGAVGVYAVDGGNLTLIETVSGNLPAQDTQGLVSF